MTSERKPACPGCQGANLGKLLSAPGMVGVGERAGNAISKVSSGGCGAGGAGCACRTNVD